MNDIVKMYREYGDKIHFGYRVPLVPSPGSPGSMPTDEELVEAAKKTMETFNIPGRYVYTGPYNPPAYRKALYELSRKAYAK